MKNTFDCADRSQKTAQGFRCRLFWLTRVPLLGIVVSLFCCLPALSQTYAFERADFGVGTTPIGGTTADFNGDRKRDMAIINFDDGSVSILLAQDNGTFAPRVDVTVGVGPTFIVTGDVNCDHKPDLIVTQGNANTVSILLGNGDGTFQLPQTFATGDYPIWADIGDFNGDGKPDLAIANYESDSTSILLGNGDGTFRPHWDLQMAPSPDSIVVGDFNGDGYLDVAVANATGQLVGIVTLGLGNGDGTLRIGKKSAVGPLPQSIRTGDFNNDGKLDIVVANLQTGVNTISLILGNGDGTFQDDHEFPTANTPYRVAVADFNRDGNLDVAVASPSNLGSYVSILLGAGNGTLQTHVDYATGGDTDWIMPIDSNHDGFPDLAVVYTDCVFGTCSGPGTGDVSILIGNGRGAFSPRHDVAIDRYPYSAELADLNGDGILDVITANASSDNLSVLLGKGDGAFQPRLDFATGAGPESVAVSDFNSDTKLDLAVANEAGNTVSILLGTGDGSFGGHMDLDTGQNPLAIVAGDFNGDGKSDLAVGNGAPANAVSILMGNGDGGFKAYQAFPVAGPVLSLAVADFNHDGNLDIVASTSTSDLSILMGNGDGSFRPHVDVSTGGTNLAVTTLDFDHDGQTDIAAACYNDNGSGYIALLLGNGDGTFQAHQDNYALPFVPFWIGAGDFDTNGQPDLVTMNYGTASLFLGKSNGTLAHYLDFATGDGSISGALGDLNQDGALDFLSSNLQSGTISVFLNTPVVTISPAKVVFAPQLIGTTSAPKTVTVSNPSIAPLTMTGMNVNGPFAYSGTCNLVIPPGGECSFDVSFAPVERGIERGAINISHNGFGGAQMALLRGTGTVVQVSPRGLNFGVEYVGIKSHLKTITIQNTGTGVLHISGISISGSNLGDFMEQNNCGLGLHAGEICMVQVSFKPSAPGQRFASLTIQDDGGANPQIVPLIGLGQ
jgi:hypothetical protein